MNPKQNALDRVTLQAGDYFNKQVETERQRQRLVEAIKDANKVDVTQQKIADACVTELPLLDGTIVTKKISRQRVAQIIQEK